MEFKDLEIWKKGLSLLTELYELTSKYPKQETYGLVDQTRRAANSVIANIAESYGRYYFADRCRVLYQSRGECFEVQSHILVAMNLKYLNETEGKKLIEEYTGLAKGINSYVSSIKKQIS